MIRPSETLVGTHLNSVWLEGTLDEDPVEHQEVAGCQFPLRTLQSRNEEPDSVFQIEASESALNGCRSRLSQGKVVRIIGRLRQCPRGVTIVSELVETMGGRV
jgi:hypothetical protein